MFSNIDVISQFFPSSLKWGQNKLKRLSLASLFQPGPMFGSKETLDCGERLEWRKHSGLFCPFVGNKEPKRYVTLAPADSALADLHLLAKLHFVYFLNC
jgi:hypothetical protein